MKACRMLSKSPPLVVLSLVLTGFFTPLKAHELWIEPEQYQVAKGNPITADFKNGEAFEGIKLSYFERGAVRFDTVMGGKVAKVTARSGDRPALALDALAAEGLLSVVYETTPSNITYKEWPKFQKFAAHKDFKTAEADHIANGWPQQGFRESYTRHAKALIGVGHGQGADKTVGLATEFTALTNPYAPDFAGEMRVLLTYQNAPRPDAQVEVFERAADDQVSVTLHRTDSNGIAVIPVKKGHSYLFDAVVLRPSPEAMKTPTSPLWETLWAALTFHVPG